MGIQVDQDAFRSLAELVALLPPDEQEAMLADLDPDQLAWDWSFWGRPAQQEPSDDDGAWTTWLILAGRGFGKTRAGAEWVRKVMTGKTPHARGRYRHMAIIAETAWDARNVLVEGDSGILSVHPPGFRPEYQPALRQLTWPNGGKAHLYNAVEPDQLRGPQHDCAWCDELAKWRYVRETWDQLQFGLRLGTDPRQLVTTTPRPIPVIRELINDQLCVVTKGKTKENVSNLAPTFLKKIVGRFEGTRLGRQELNAEVLDDVPGALWTRQMIDAKRLKADQRYPDLSRVVVAIDPSGTSGEDDENANSVGIVVAARGVDGRGYVLADWTCDLSPEGWGRRAIQAYKRYEADRIVAESNYGGAMVEAVIRSIDKKVSYKEVKASRGKVVRAEPISALYEQGKISHVGTLPELEDQMCNFTSTGYVGDGSPDRADALVWALTEVMLGGSSYRINL